MATSKRYQLSGPTYTPVTKKRVPKFNPDREYIEQAINDYLAFGGLVTKLGYDTAAEERHWISTAGNIKETINKPFFHS